MRYIDAPPITASVTSVVNTRMPPEPSPPPNTTSMTRSIATTMARTASANSSTSRVEVRRALAWCSKKVTGGAGNREWGIGNRVSGVGPTRPLPGSSAAGGTWSTAIDRRGGTCGPASPIPEYPFPIPGPSELDLRRRPHLCLLVGRDLQQLGRGEVEHAGDDARGEQFALVVAGHHRIIEGLARESHAVLGYGQLLGELHHFLVGLEVRVGLDGHQQAAQRAVEHALAAAELGHRGRVAGRGLGGGQPGLGGVAG